MLVLSLRQNGFRRISLPNRAIIVQRMVHWRAQKFRAINNAKSESDAGSKVEVSDDSTFPERVDSLWKVGAHVSALGGMENTVTNAVSMGANSFALFLKSPFQWKSLPLTPRSISEFKERMKQYGYANNMVLPISNYLIHLGNPNRDKREKSYECFLDDLQRCEALGLELYHFRPGSTFGATSTESSITLIAESINWAHRATKSVTIVLKNMQGARNVIGSKFSELAGIIAKVKDKKRVGVCLDTCNAFAAGYDIRTKEGWDATMSELDKEIGLNYLRGMLLGDSKTACNSKKDLHENIGLGHLGITTFRHILQDPRTQNIPLIVATPCFNQPKVIWGKEIGVLQALTNTPVAMKYGGDLQSLAHEITSAVEEAKSKSTKLKSEREKKRVGKRTKVTDSDSAVGKSVEELESLQSLPQNEPELPVEPELPAKRKLPANWKRNTLWQSYLI